MSNRDNHHYKEKNKIYKKCGFCATEKGKRVKGSLSRGAMSSLGRLGMKKGVSGVGGVE